MTQTCPCGSNNAYLNCCGAFISGARRPETPEQLMRSRYTAYTQANIDYISRTMKGPAMVGFDPEAARAWAEGNAWLRLDVLNASVKGTTGFVEFAAHYAYQNKDHIIHERSEFRLEDGQWYYTRGHSRTRR